MLDRMVKQKLVFFLFIVSVVFFAFMISPTKEEKILKHIKENYGNAYHDVSQYLEEKGSFDACFDDQKSYESPIILCALVVRVMGELGIKVKK